jgi:prevent-host-death family protein
VKSIGIFEIKSKLSEICHEVALTGEPIAITKRGKPLVRILPAEDWPTSALARRITYIANHEESVAPADFDPPPD